MNQDDIKLYGEIKEVIGGLRATLDNLEKVVDELLDESRRAAEVLEHSEDRALVFSDVRGVNDMLKVAYEAMEKHPQDCSCDDCQDPTEEILQEYYAKRGMEYC